MVNRRASDAVAPSTPIAPVVKRKRRASCLGEQERRERKRAIDREAQRSLREKTKTHIAELEKTIQILRDQDHNGATASLLSEIETLRLENERLRDVIDSVKSVVGCDLFGGRSHGNQEPSTTSNEIVVQTRESNSPRDGSVGQPSPREPQQRDTKPTLPLPTASVLQDPMSSQFNFNQVSHPSRIVDLDGMRMLTELPPNVAMDLDIELHPIEELSEDTPPPDETSILSCPDSPTTAAFAPFISEIFGPSWRCPSPIILHIGNPSTSSPSSSLSIPKSICPIWKKSNEVFGKVFNYRPGTADLNTDAVESGLLYLAIKQGWSSFDEWMQSPALSILKEMDELLFGRLERTERLAVSYKSFKLLKYYLTATSPSLQKVPPWLRPSFSQSRTSHPIALDFFAWPTLRDRLIQSHSLIFQTEDLSRAYGQYVRFDWPFSFEDAFFMNEDEGMWYPSPLFEKYHMDIKYWGVREEFFQVFPEMRGDIEGDRRRFSEVGVSVFGERK